MARILIATALLLPACGGDAAARSVVHVAAAANVADAVRELARRYEEHTGHEVALSVGSTGALYAQAANGAPFEVFLAADLERPERLEEQALAVAGTRFTYAVGRLVLWSRDPELVDPEGAVLASGGFRRLALANPNLAPYGQAARAVLEGRGLWEELQPRIVRGENVAQTYQFVHSGNAELGFVALAQLAPDAGGSRWVVPAALHAPIEQQAVLLADDGAARGFLEFVRSDEGRAVLRGHGYETP